MGTDQKVAVITGASQGIGATLVRAYRDRNYRVVATARSIRPSDDDQVLTVPGDIADRKTAERAISEGVARFGRIDTLINNAGIFIAKPFAVAEMEKQGSGHVVDHDEPGRSRDRRRTLGARVPYEGRPGRRDQIARDRVCRARY